MHNNDYTIKDGLLLKRQLDILSRELQKAIFNLNFLQDKFIINLKKLDEKKHEIYSNEYLSHLKYLKEEYKNTGKFQSINNDEGILNSEIYKKETLKFKIDLLRRLKLDDELQNLPLEELDATSKILTKNEISFGNKIIQSNFNFKTKLSSLSDIASSFPNFQRRNFEIHEEK
jgi:hypothetical protein